MKLKIKVALNHFKLGALFMEKGKGGTYPKGKGHLLQNKKST